MYAVKASGKKDYIYEQEIKAFRKGQKDKRDDRKGSRTMKRDHGGESSNQLKVGEVSANYDQFDNNSWEE
jgi:hypothetical protein